MWLKGGDVRNSERLYAGAGGFRYPSASPHLRRSLPNMTPMSTEPLKVYPYHLLITSNYRLPADADRNNLEVIFKSINSISLLIWITIAGDFLNNLFYTASFEWCWVWSYFPYESYRILPSAGLETKWNQKTGSSFLKKKYLMSKTRNYENLKKRSVSHNSTWTNIKKITCLHQKKNIIYKVRV